MLAKARFGRGRHAMHPLDAAARTWIARRNVNLVIITAGLLLGQAEAAFYLICGRSEEHTSELQSLMRISYAVFCLKKKKQRHRHHMRNIIIHSSNITRHIKIML